MVHPQKRLDMRKALEACIGRMLEVRHWMVKLNRGLDFISLDDILVDLKLTPEVLEVPVPKYFIEDRAKELDDRDKFLEALVEKYNVKPPQPSPIIKIGAPLAEEDAVLLLQKNERGTQHAWQQHGKRACFMLTDWNWLQAHDACVCGGLHLLYKT